MLEVNTIISTVNDHLSSSTDRTKGYNLSELTDIAAASIINQLTFVGLFQDVRENFFELREAIEQAFKDFMHPAIIMIIAFPWLRYFPIFSHFFKRAEKNDETMDNFFSKNINDTIQRQTKEKQAGDKIFTMKALKGLCVDLFIAGQDTTSNTLRFLVLYMMLFPETQAKMQQELDEVLGDKKMARKGNAALLQPCSLNLIHRTTKDVVCGGYKIAKGTRIVPMISTVLYDQKFMPERFIENGQLKKCEELIPFSIGKRQCVGESLARMELFLFTANFFYLFKIRTVDPSNPPSLHKNAGLTVSPVDYKCIIEKRKQNLV
uniref:Cytochrome P450 n=1 Tax=Ditylenchus dipsaci TaxID=166011 RepID=A0A915DE60_9BILA